jgi:hypothetical protein
VAGCAVFMLVVAASYAGAALATPNPPWGYLNEIGVTARYVGSTDSFNNTTRPPLGELAATFFVTRIVAEKGGWRSSRSPPSVSPRRRSAAALPWRSFWRCSFRSRSSAG